MSDEKDWKMGGSYPGMEPGLGCLHDAHHPDTGAPGLVLTSDERVDWSFQDDWRVSLSCKRDSATVKLLVEEAPAEGEVSTLVNMFVLITSAFSRVEDHSRLQAHLTSKPEARKPGWMARLPLPRNVTGWAFAGLVVLALSACIYGLQAVRTPEDTTSQSPDASAETFAQEPDFINAVEPEATGIAYPLPAKPYKKQAVPPCQTTLGEEEINGGCWMDMNQKPPCYANRAEYKGKCYMPVSKDRSGDSPAQAVDP
ncbi:hypothetical protein D187_004904 [Cystobacter fuscus DSM 2262]|uniref:Protein kinase n=1 Tax=Cystobacter fuscus (strain ATCC 25194 / DSM 2262 / NBRC 100088 / M29) TaxID=1242864 RepID=S9P349_CYSF2|nr:hypothetical protein [Cystobacter fuscus]EPX57571.1 hypothetical protein D187_004904 [Cystobacter fuscus DSM 2262]